MVSFFGRVRPFDVLHYLFIFFSYRYGITVFIKMIMKHHPFVY